MKKKFTLLLLLVLAGFTARAERGLRPEFTDYGITDIPEDATFYYLYEPNLKAFFSEGNKWGAEATLNTASPKKFFFQKYIPEGAEWDGKSFRMNNWVVNSFWDHMFICDKKVSGEDINYIVSDCTSGLGTSCRGDDFWCFEWAEDGTAKIYVSDHSTVFGETALGQKAYMATTNFPGNTRIGLSVPGFSNLEYDYVLNWVVVNAATYETDIQLYDKAFELKHLIEGIKKNYPDMNVSAAQAVFDNSGSTLEELQATVDQLKQAIELKRVITATKTNQPGVDVSAAQTVLDNPESTPEELQTALDQLYLILPKGQGVKPNPLDYKVTEMVTSENEFGQLFYLYAPTLDAFISEGNTFDVEATLGNKPYNKMYFTEYTRPGEEWDGESYRMVTWVNNRGYWDHIFHFIIQRNYVCMDCSIGGLSACRGDDFWSFEWNEDGTVKIYVSKASAQYSETALGYRAYLSTSGNPDITRVGLNIPGHSDVEFPEVLDWAIVDMAAYDVMRIPWEKSEELRLVIQTTEAEQKGIDLSSVKNVYNNPASTVEEMQAAIEAIPGLVYDFLMSKAGGATLEAPVDMTALVSTPDYNEGHADGWQGDAVTVADGFAQLAGLTEGFNVYQDIKDIPNGVYRINVQGMYRAAAVNAALYAEGVCKEPERERAFVYGESNGNRLRTHIMGHMAEESGSFHDTDFEYPNGLFVPTTTAAFAAWTAEGCYSKNETYVEVKDGTLRMGLYSDYIPDAQNWCVFGNWKLEYCGTGMDAYAMIREQMVNFRDFEPKAQSTLMEEYSGRLDVLNAAGTPEEVLAACDGLSALQDTISYSIMAMYDYVAAMDVIQTYLEENTDFSGTDREFLESYFTSDEGPGTYPNGGYLYILENTPLSNAQLAEEAVYVQALLDKAIHTGFGEGADITRLLVNADMSQPKLEGWNYPASDYADSGMGLPELPVAQAAATGFDLHQTLEDMPDGVYELSLNAFTRFASNWTNRDNDVVPVELYLNEFATPIQNITSDMIAAEDAVNRVNCYVDRPGKWPYDNAVSRDGKTYYTPNSVEGASYAFMAGRYKQTVYGLVTDGKLTIGIRDQRESSGEWSVFTNFRLIYQAKNPEAMAAVLENFLKRAEEYQAAADVTGTNSFYREYYTNIQSMAEAFHATDDADAKSDLLIAINEELKKIPSSIELYKELVSVLELAYNTYWDNVDVTYTKEEVDAFVNNIYNPTYVGIQMGTLSDEEVQAKIAELMSLPVFEAPQPDIRWTFDNPDDLLAAAVGEATLQSVVSDGTLYEKFDDAVSAGITAVEGPTAENGAIHLPANAGLFSTLGQTGQNINYTIQLDIKVQDAESYNAILQFDSTNQEDAGLSYYNGQIGGEQLHYSGSIQADTWQRVHFVNSNGLFTIFVDGKRCNSYDNPNRWCITPEDLLFFVDNDGGRVETEVAEITFWNTPLSDYQIVNMGEVGSTATSIERIEGIEQTPVQQTVVGTYDLMGRKLNAGKLQKGIYIRDGRKVIVR